MFYPVYKNTALGKNRQLKNKLFRMLKFKWQQDIREENCRPFVNVRLDGLCLIYIYKERRNEWQKPSWAIVCKLFLKIMKNSL